MALLDLFRKRENRGNPLENPAVSLASGGFFSWLNGGEPTAAGEEINHFTAMQSVSVFACVRIIAESVASLPCKLYSDTAKGRFEAFDTPLHDILSVQPNIEMSAFSFWETLVGCLALTGNSYAQIIRNGAGQVDSLYPLHPLKTEPYRRPDGVLAYRTTDGQSNGSWRSIDNADIISVPLFSYDGLKGLSPILQAKQSIGLAKAAEKFGARFFGNGSRPGGVMSTSSVLDEKAQQNTRDSWERTQSGSNQGKTAFLMGDWKYERIGLSPEESQFLATRKYQREDIAALFRVPVNMIGDTSRLSNANHEQQQLSFITDTIRPYLTRLENELARKLLPKQGRNSGRFTIAWDVSERLRTDFETQQKGNQTGVLSGWLSRADVRHAMGLNPGPDHLATYMVPVNMQAGERLLDTEPITDQPLGTDPYADSKPTSEERNLLGAYSRAYLTMYRSAFGSLSTRAKRDLPTLTGLFQPVLRSIADLSVETNGLDSEHQGDPADIVVADVLRSMSKRSASWPSPIPDADLTALVSAEFTKAVRSIHINITKEIAAAKASADLKPEDLWTVEN